MQNKNKKKLFTVKTFMVWFFIIIMTFSIGGYFLSDNSDGSTIVNENGQNFYQESGFWKTKVNGKVMSFSYLPSQLDTISFDPKAAELIAGKTIFITFNPDEYNLQNIDLARFLISQDFAQNFGIYTIGAVTKPNNVYASLQTMTCDNSTKDYPVIYMKVDNEIITGNGKVFVQSDCVIMEGPSNDFVMLKDRLVYHMTGIMK